MKQSSAILYGVEDRPPLLTSLLLALQYVLLTIGGMMLTPVILANATGMQPAQTEFLVFSVLLVSALTTLIQVRRPAGIGSGYLMILGPSGAFIACGISAISMGGLPLLATMTILSAPLEAAIAFLIRYVRRVFTPALGGTVIMLVAMLLIPLTIGMWSGEQDDPLYCSPAYLLTGLVPVVVILGSYLSDRPWVRLWSPIIGVILGLGVAALYGIADFHPLGQYPVVALPGSGWPGLNFHLGARHIPLFITFLMATLTSTIETFGDTVALQTVSEGGLRKIKYDRIQGGMYIDAIGSTIGGLAGSLPNTTYSSVMPVIQLTRVSSRVIGYYVAAMLAVIAFLPKLAYFFLYLPEPVMGGLSIGLTIILFGEGFKVAASAEQNAENALVVGTGLSMGLLAGVGMFFPEAFPGSFQFLAADVISIGGFSALLVNLVFVFKVRKTEHLAMPASITRLPALMDKIDSFEQRFRLKGRQKYALQLACEEVFAFYCRQNPDEHSLLFRWKYHPDHILCEVAASGLLSDLEAAPDPLQLQMQDEESLKKLELHLLARVASHTQHTEIDGRHYVSFRV